MTNWRKILSWRTEPVDEWVGWLITYKLAGEDSHRYGVVIGEKWGRLYAWFEDSIDQAKDIFGTYMADPTAHLGKLSTIQRAWAIKLEFVENILLDLDIELPF